MKNRTTNPQKRRRHTNRNQCSCPIRNLMGTSLGQPAHLSFYLHPALDTNGKPDRAKIVELFNTENYA